MDTFFPAPNGSILERLLMRLCLKGPMPSHIGYIMDGNRRYAVKQGIEKIIGHSRGIEKLRHVWSLHREMGITQATLFTFSIANFKRSPEELDQLESLCVQFLRLLLKELPQFIEANICVRFIGRIDLFDSVLQHSIARIELATVGCTGFNLNIALGYSAREEMTTALNDLMKAVKEGILQPDDINEATFSRALYTRGMAEPEIMVRTSGEIRLSDFLLWQANYSLVQFVPQLWPEYSIWNVIAQLLNFQVASRVLAQGRQEMGAEMRKADLQYCQQVWSQAKGGRTLSEFIQLRNQRIDRAIEFIHQKRLDALRDILRETSDAGEAE